MEQLHKTSTEGYRKKSILENFEETATSNNSLTILLLNVSSLLKHTMNIASDNMIMRNDILCFTETQIQQTQFDNDE